MRLTIFFILFFALSFGYSQDSVDIVIVGGGAGGTAAGIQAARSGTAVLILEATPWLGGMLTAAGVSAIDGNHNLPSGIWGEFRRKLRSHYGGAEALATGWVSHTLFEPDVGKNILTEMADLPNLEIAYESIVENASWIPTATADAVGKWKITYNREGVSKEVVATILIDATETGALLPVVGADFRLGMDARSDTGETQAPENRNSIVQDQTYVAILEDVSDGDDKTRSTSGLVAKPENYNAEDYACACKREGGEMFGSVSDCAQMLNYGKLPGGKYMINWPHCGNDYYLDWPEAGESEMQERIAKAKEFTLGFVYYIQQELGFDHLRLANLYPTADQLPFIPYHREGRRVKGKVFLTVSHLERPYDYSLYRTGIAVGDYPIDHHHDKRPDAPEIDFISIRIPSYNIPMGSLIPEQIENFIVAEKNISVSNIVNGTTRLQPVVLGIGQAAGALAALAVRSERSPGEVPVRELQAELLNHGAYLIPFMDVSIEDPAFQCVQRIGLTGILKGTGIPYKWANQTFFYPDREVSEKELLHGLLPYYPALEGMKASKTALTLPFLKTLLEQLGVNSKALSKLEDSWTGWGIEQPYGATAPLNRRTISILLDQLLNPFAKEIDLEGNLKVEG